MERAKVIILCRHLYRWRPKTLERAFARARLVFAGFFTVMSVGGKLDWANLVTMTSTDFYSSDINWEVG